MQQEPGANATEIWNGIKYVRPGHGFEPSFQLFAKVEANGENEVPLYTYLKVRISLKFLLSILSFMLTIQFLLSACRKYAPLQEQVMERRKIYITSP